MLRTCSRASIVARLRSQNGLNQIWLLLGQESLAYFSFSRSKSHSVVSEYIVRELYSPWNSPGQNTGVGSLSLLQGIFPTWGSTGVSCVAGGFFTSWATGEACLSPGTPPPFYLLVPLRELVTDAVTQLAICSVVTILKFLICEQAAPTFWLYTEPCKLCSQGYLHPL